MFFQGYSFNATVQNNTLPSPIATVTAFQLPLTYSEDLITRSSCQRNWCTRALFVYTATKKCLLLTCFHVCSGNYNRKASRINLLQDFVRGTKFLLFARNLKWGEFGNELRSHQSMRDLKSISWLEDDNSTCLWNNWMSRPYDQNFWQI